MANMFGTGNRRVAQTRKPQNLVFEDFTPSSGLTEDSDSYCLIIDLPGFKKDEVKLQVDDNGHIIVSGERQVNEMKHVRFQQSYKVPEKSNIEETTAKFEDDILYIVIPKLTKDAIVEDNSQNSNINPQTDQVNHPQEQEENKPNAFHKVEVPDPGKMSAISSKPGDVATTENEAKEERQDEEFHDANLENQWNEGSILETLKVQLLKNKGIVVAAVLAFSLGVLVSQKLQTSHETWKET
ncbi:OLC1v1012699C1 [Oldenlandia corymbosa var. corymbosa]|uniref:OLC1v1012699C1 n=1 Tax=Oldenlandia corymbosa var. corymbosa TaxID=529605 RepID=A0AAV1DZY1_OLDCO|nr:OLC1v1012699C1 [Oldenlandia corymbosa var. corymbosa]